MTAVRHISVRRGQPLVMLATILVGWIGLRAAFWEWIALPELVPPRVVALAQSLSAQIVPLAGPAIVPTKQGALRSAELPFVPPRMPFVAAAPLPPATVSEPAPLPDFGSTGSSGEESRVAAAHQLAWMAGVAQLPIPRFIAERASFGTRAPNPISIPAIAPTSLRAQTKNWSADGWLLLRQGGASLTVGGLPSPSYGASQVGSVIRYRLEPRLRQRPFAYLRASGALQRPHGEEAALGLSLRPLVDLPVSIQAEIRASQQDLGVVLRPAVAAVSELGRIAMPAGLSAEAYAQAGYVGGASATAFADGQIRVERALARLPQGELRIGLGAWGGAQRGARRIDVGPTATIDFAIGAGQGRLVADWRLRAAGNAAPQSGAAITLSAGF